MSDGPVRRNLRRPAAHRALAAREFVVWAVAFALPLVVPRMRCWSTRSPSSRCSRCRSTSSSGYTGIVSLGHAAFFGFGAYAAALFAKLVMPDPTVGLVFATVLSALAARPRHQRDDPARQRPHAADGHARHRAALLELANKLDWLTGGADGLQGVVMGPVLGLFDFDLYGRTAAWYSLAVMLVLFLRDAPAGANSPFGATLKAIRDNRLRAMAIGIPVVSRLAVVYTVAAGMPARQARCSRRPPASPRSTCWPSTARPTCC
jgi:branched-chain amino acid transport system permease protein